MGKKKIFLSSVFDDDFTLGFSLERDALKSLFINYEDHFEIIDLDNNRPDPSFSPFQKSLEAIYMSDIIILFLGKKYGGTLYCKNDAKSFIFGNKKLDNYIIDNIYGNDIELSLTHLEYRLAKYFQKPTFVYAFEKEDNISDSQQKQFLKEAFSDKVACDINKHCQDLWSSVLELKTGRDVDIDEDEKKRYAESLALKMILDIYYYQDRFQTSFSYEKNWRIFENVDPEENLFIVITDIQNNQLNNVDEIRKNILNNKVDQKYLYYSPKSAEKWSKWEENGATTSQVSNINLINFFNLDIWKEKVNEIDTVVDLGTGAGYKAIELIESFDKNYHGNELNLVLVDSSNNMLDIALRNTTKNLKNLKFKVNVDGLRTDFLMLHESNNLFHHSDKKRSVFMLLGGTFGNIDEEKFISALNQVCQKGDLFILTAFLLKDDQSNLIPYEKYRDEIIEIYSPSLDELGISLVDISFNMNNSNKPIKSKKIKFLGEIKHVKSNPVHVNLLSSNRYDLEDLKQYIKGKNYLLLDEIISDDEDSRIGTFLYEFKG